MTRRSLAYALALLCCSASALRAATVDSRSIACVPLRYSAGDEVILQAPILPDGGETLAALDLKPGSGLPAQAGDADPELRWLKLSQAQGGWTLSLCFVPWSPGAGRLPALRAGGVSIPALPYAALSLLGPEDRDPSPPRPQRVPPRTALYLYGSAGVLVALVLLALLVAFYLVPAARTLLARRRAAQAFRRLEKSLDYLESEAESADPAAFFAALSRALRLYLAARALPSAPALTASEIALLPELDFPAPGTRDRAAALIARGDRARYGGETPARGGASSGQELALAAREARAIGQETEEAIDARL